MQTSSTDIKAKAKMVEDIYHEYAKRLGILAKEQNRIIKEFLNSIKEKRLKEIREKLGSI